MKLVQHDDFWHQLSERARIRKVQIENRIAMMASIKDSLVLPIETPEKKPQNLIRRSTSNLGNEKFNEQILDFPLQKSSLKKSMTLAVNTYLNHFDEEKRLSNLVSYESFENSSPNSARLFNQSLIETTIKKSEKNNTLLWKNHDDKNLDQLPTMNNFKLLRKNKSDKGEFSNHRKKTAEEFPFSPNLSGKNKILLKKKLENKNLRLKIRRKKNFLSTERNKGNNGVIGTGLLSRRARENSMRNFNEYGVTMYSMNAFPVYCALYSPH